MAFFRALTSALMPFFGSSWLELKTPKMDIVILAKSNETLFKTFMFIIDILEPSSNFKKATNSSSFSTSTFEKFSKPKVTPIWDMISSWFFGGNMLFSSFIVRDYNNLKGYHYKAIFMDVYSSAVPYVFVGSVLLLVIWSYIKNFKNKLVQILMISFFVDIIIHCGLKFGLHTSYIYGGHFVFVIPMMLGWLFYGYRTSPKMLTFLFVFVGMLLVYLVANNIYRMEEFFLFMEKYYR
mgnify:CR=1 FL=1